MAWLLAVSALASAAADDTPALLDFSPAEQRRILQHGPWPPPPPPPPPPARDAGNALSGRPAAVALGRALFFDTRLSPDGRFACATCHAPTQAFTDGLPRSMGRDVLDRNAPSLWNAAHERWYGWDGAFDSLWSQALHPLLNPREMGSSAAHVAALVTGDAALSCLYRRSVERGATRGRVAKPPATTHLADDTEATLVHVAKALGAFVATLESGPTPFDAFRDALARGDRAAAARYPLSAQRGLRLFIGRGQCSTCHVGPRFSNGEFGDIGVPFFVRPGVVDPGRHGGIAALRASRHNLLSRWSDAPDGEAALKTRHVDPLHRNFGEFKVPSLRNVADTAPYTHAGQLATLDDVVRHYSELNLDRLHADGDQILRPLQLSAGEHADLVAFLRTLSDPRAAQWQLPGPTSLKSDGRSKPARIADCRS